jgi:acetyl esterase/lipase
MPRSSRHLVDPALLPALDLIPDLDLDASRLAELRAGMDGFIPPLESFACDDVLIERREIVGAGGTFGLQLFRPASPATSQCPALLFIHGGGYVLGCATQNAPGNIRTVRELGCLVASVEYDLAPEACGTHAVEQCHAALLWLVANAEELGIDGSRIAVGGESAGGGLAAALCLLARDRGGPQPCFQMLIYPMLDSRTGLEESHPLVGEFVWTAAANQFGWRSLLGDSDPDDPAGHVVPARAADLSGLPPAYISVGALDLFLEEDIEYARRLTRAGVPVELNLYPAAFHGFELAADAEVSQRSERDRRDALRRAFTR